MNETGNNDFVPLLQQLNALLLHKEHFSGDVFDHAIFGRWCGRPPATESEVLAAERRLGVRLPPSYRSFLSISNGWRPFNSFVEQLLPVQEVDRFRTLVPERFASFELARERALALYGEEELAVSDEVYLDYENPAHNILTRDQYYGDSLLISESAGTELVLLNPFIVSANGEWETIFSAHWIPGNQRFRSFRDYLENSVRDEEEASQSS